MSVNLDNVNLSSSFRDRVSTLLHNNRETSTMSDIPPQSGTDGSIDVHFDDEIAVVTIKRGENRINTSFYEELNKALDEVER